MNETAKKILIEAFLAKSEQLGVLMDSIDFQNQELERLNKIKEKEISNLNDIMISFGESDEDGIFWIEIDGEKRGYKLI